MARKELSPDKTLTVDVDDRCHASPALLWECRDWLITVENRQRGEFVSFLLGETRRMASDGVSCRFMTRWLRSQAPAGTCMCARLLMLLHDISEEECNSEMFARLLALIDPAREIPAG